MSLNDEDKDYYKRRVKILEREKFHLERMVFEIAEILQGATGDNEFDISSSTVLDILQYIRKFAKEYGQRNNVEQTFREVERTIHDNVIDETLLHKQGTETHQKEKTGIDQTDLKTEENAPTRYHEADYINRANAAYENDESLDIKPSIETLNNEVSNRGERVQRFTADNVEGCEYDIPDVKPTIELLTNNEVTDGVEGITQQDTVNSKDSENEKHGFQISKETVPNDEITIRHEEVVQRFTAYNAKGGENNISIVKVITETLPSNEIKLISSGEDKVQRFTAANVEGVQNEHLDVKPEAEENTQSLTNGNCKDSENEICGGNITTKTLPSNEITSGDKDIVQRCSADDNDEHSENENLDVNKTHKTLPSNDITSGEEIIVQMSTDDYINSSENESCDMEVSKDTLQNNEVSSDTEENIQTSSADDDKSGANDMSELKIDDVELMSEKQSRKRKCDPYKIIQDGTGWFYCVCGEQVSSKIELEKHWESMDEHTNKKQRLHDVGDPCSVESEKESDDSRPSLACPVSIKPEPDVLECPSAQVELTPFRQVKVENSLKDQVNSENYISDDEEDINGIDEGSILRDRENPSIYIRKVLKTDTTKDGKLKKSDRVFNSYQYCGACDKQVSNFSQHISRNNSKHNSCQEIQEIAWEPDIKRRNVLRTLLRGKFNHEFNMRTLKRGHGEIILERRPNIFSVEEFGPCPNCLLWISKRLLGKHQHSCCGSQNDGPISILITQSDTLCGRISCSASQKLSKEVFEKMKMDEIGMVVRNDPLIIQLGNQWIQNNVGKRGTYTSQIVRLVGRLLLNLRKVKPLHIDDFMFDYLKPEHFESICQATIMTSASNMDDEDDLKEPNNAIKLGFDIKRLINGKIGQSIMSGDTSSRKDAEDLLKMMEIHWDTRVTELARVVLEERKYGKHVHLPHPDDIKTLNTYLNSTIKELDLKSKDYFNYMYVCQVIEAKLVLYNRRRTGEIQAVRLVDYHQRKTTSQSEDIIGECSPFEKKLLETQEIVTVWGKTGRGVPIILPLEVKGGLEFISSKTVRQRAGIDIGNRYLFADKGDGVFWAYDSLLTACQKVNVRSPDRITSTSLRNYMATLTRVLDFSSFQLQRVLNHIGHTLYVHQIYYWATSDILDRTQIAKILLLQDHDRVGDFLNKKLEDIHFSDIVFPETSAPTLDQAHFHLEGVCDIENNDNNDPDNIQEALHEAEEFFTEERNELGSSGKQSRKSPVSVKKTLWTQAEEEEIKKLFQKFFENKTRPDPSFCLKAIARSKKNGGLLQHRKKDVLKKKVFRMIDKLE